MAALNEVQSLEDSDLDWDDLETASDGDYENTYKAEIVDFDEFGNEQVTPADESDTERDDAFMEIIGDGEEDEDEEGTVALDAKASQARGEALE
jgi:hypothetical protein